MSNMVQIQEVYEATTAFHKETNQVIKLSEGEFHNMILDEILKYQAKIQNINKDFISIIEILNGLFETESNDLSENDRDIIKDIIKELQEIRKITTRFFLLLESIEFIKIGCNSDMTDLRVNIRTILEIENDIDSILLNDYAKNNIKLKELLSSF